MAALLGSFAVAGGVIAVNRANEPTPTPFANKPDDSRSFDGTKTIPPGFPPHWNLLPPATRQQLLSIHHGLLTMERICGADAAARVVAHIMGSSDYLPDPRFVLARYVQELPRWDLLPALSLGLPGALNDRKIRAIVASACLGGAISATLSVPPELKLILEAYLGSGLETDPELQRWIELALHRLP